MRYFVLGVIKDSNQSKEDKIRKVVVLNESLLEFNLSSVTSIGCSMTAPKHMIRTITIDKLAELLEDGDTITNAKVSKNGELSILNGYKVAIITKAFGRTVSVIGENLIQAIYSTSISLRGLSPRLVLICCDVLGNIKMVDCTNNKPPELMAQEMVNCYMKQNSNGKLILSRNKGNLRHSNFHLSRMLLVTETSEGEIYLDVSGMYQFVNTKNLDIHVSDRIELDWLVNKGNISKIQLKCTDMLDMYNKGVVQDILSKPKIALDVDKRNLALSIIGNTRGDASNLDRNYYTNNKVVAPTLLESKHGRYNRIKTVGYLDINNLIAPEVLKCNSSEELTEFYWDAYEVPPVFDAVDIFKDFKMYRGIDENFFNAFDLILEGHIYGIKLSKRSNMAQRYGVHYLATVYFPKTKKLLDLKYYGLRVHKNKQGKYVVNAFYKATNNSTGRIANFMDVIDGETGDILRTTMLTESLVDTIIQDYISNNYMLGGSQKINNAETSRLLEYKKVLKRMCIIDSKF